MKQVVLVLMVAVLVFANGLSAQQVAEKQLQQDLESVGFDIYHVKRSDGTTLQCYLSNSPKQLPLMVNFEGSGASSAFQKQGERINGGMAGYLSAVSEGLAHVLVVEKPGVKLFEEGQGGRVDQASETFLKNYTLEYLTQSNIEAIRAILRLPQVKSDRVILFGISDGGQLAAETSAHLPEATHVVALACGGPTQIFDYVLEVSKPKPEDKPGDVQKRVDEIYAKWDEIMQDPNSIEKFWSGHPYRRWSSFCASSTTDALMKTKAKIYLAHGTADTSVPVQSFDVLVSTLRSRGKQVTAERLDGLSHHFQTEQESRDRQYGNMDRLIDRIVKWSQLD